MSELHERVDAQPSPVVSSDRLVLPLGAGVDMVLMFVPPGTLALSSECLDIRRELPAGAPLPESVTIEQGFFISQSPVTREQWDSVTGTRVDTSRNGPSATIETTWSGAQTFCEMMSTHMGHEVNVPTRDEWLFAVLGNSKLWSPADTSENDSPSVPCSREHAVDPSALSYEWVADWDQLFPANSSGELHVPFKTLFASGNVERDNRRCCIYGRSESISQNQPSASFRVVIGGDVEARQKACKPERGLALLDSPRVTLYMKRLTFDHIGESQPVGDSHLTLLASNVSDGTATFRLGGALEVAEVRAGEFIGSGESLRLNAVRESEVIVELHWCE